MYHDKTKHVDIKYHFVRDMIKSETIIIEKISTNENVENILTKTLPSKEVQLLFRVVEYY